MPDFEKSFQAGLDAARNTQAARAEVRSVFDEFNAGLSRASGGAAKLVIEERKEPISKKGNNLSIGLHFLTEYQAYDALVIQNVAAKNVSGREVARWRQYELGYPCWIAMSGREIACGDKQSLEALLSELAASSHFGEAVLAAMAHQAKAASAPAPPTPPSQSASGATS